MSGQAVSILWNGETPYLLKEPQIHPVLWLSCPKAKEARLKAAETVKSENTVRPPQSWSEAAVMSAHITLALLLLSCISPVWTNVDNEVQIFLDDFNTEAVPIIYASSLASWDYNTNITSTTQENMVRSQDAI